MPEDPRPSSRVGSTSRQVAGQLGRGFLMGSADIVPGVSGGTVALVLGIYERLIANVSAGALVLASVAKLELGTAVRRLRHIEWGWLLPLFGGILAAIAVLAHAIEVLLEEEPVRASALFFGLIVASVGLAWKQVRQRDLRRYATAGVTAVAVYFVLGLKSGPVEDPAWWLLFGAGAVAICAMILPGVSGSFLLLMLGMYETVLGLVNDREVVLLGVFTLGCVLGLASFSSLLRWLLAHHHETVLASMIGLMAGSLRVLWPWPDGTESAINAMPSGDVAVPVAMALGAAVAITVVARLAAAPHRSA